MQNWTDQQHIEMLKVIETEVKLAQTIRAVGFAIPSLKNAEGLEAPRLAHPSLLWLVNMVNGFNEAWLCGTRRYSDPGTQVVGHGCGEQDAPTRTTGMFSKIDSTLTAYKAKAIQALNSIGLTAQASALATLPLETMNRDLAIYTKADTSGTVIGPHGSMDHAITSMQIALNYALELGYEGLVPLFAVTDPGSTILKNIFTALGDMYERLYRISGLDFALELPDDKATILADAAAGTGLRPPSFFRLILESEYLGGRATFPLHSGRTCKAGVADAYHTMIAQLASWQASNRLSSDATGKMNPLFFRCFEKLGNSWVKLENWSCAVTIFPFEIPAPPPAGEPVEIIKEVIVEKIVEVPVPATEMTVETDTHRIVLTQK